MAASEPERHVHGQYRMCRVFMHAWDYTTVKRDGGELIQGLVCIRCGTERYMRVNSFNGDRMGSTYKYADGYLLKGGGALSQQERSELRLEEIQGHLKRRRKRPGGSGL